MKSSYLYLLHLSVAVLLFSMQQRTPSKIRKTWVNNWNHRGPFDSCKKTLPEFHHPHLPWLFITCVRSNSWTYDDLVIFDTISIWMTSFPYQCISLMIPLDIMVPKDPFLFFLMVLNRSFELVIAIKKFIVVMKAFTRSN